MLDWIRLEAIRQVCQSVVWACLASGCRAIVTGRRVIQSYVSYLFRKEVDRSMEGNNGSQAKEMYGA
jgi:hypothetical protein